MLAAPSSASATTRFGANLNRAPDSSHTCGEFGFQTCSWESIDPGTGESGFPPVGRGVVSRVRVRVGPFTGPMQVVVEEALRQENPSDPGHPTYACCKAVEVSRVFTPAPNAVTPVSVNLHVRQDAAPDPHTGYYVDDHLALSVLNPNVPIPASSDVNASLSGWFPAWQSGQERCCPYGTSGYVILFNADWNPLNGGRLTLGRPVISRDGTARLGVRVPGPGVLRLADGTRAARASNATAASSTTPLIASVRRTMKKGGRVTLKISPSRAGRAILRRKHKLAVRVRITFRRNDRRTVPAATKRITLRLRT
jgi:hypothetical protein